MNSKNIVLFLGLITITAGLDILTSIVLEKGGCAGLEPGFFYYFAYGSNLLRSRMHINCPTAEDCSVATLDGWRLDFSSIGENAWNGAVATVVKDVNANVTGYVWRISDKESHKLDSQEGLGQIYNKEDVTVRLPSGGTVTARVYVMINQPPKVEPEHIPLERQPSRTYLQVILFGAIERRIPVIHIEYINRFPHNGRIASSERRKVLGYPFYDDTFP